jgi:hypothetical protein
VPVFHWHSLRPFGKRECTPVVSELIGRQSQSRTAVFRSEPSDQVRARRAGAMLLFLTRKALNALDVATGVLPRTRIAATFVHEARKTLIRLRALDINHDPGFGLISTRVRQRLGQIRACIPVMDDALADLHLIDAELLVLSGNFAAAYAGLESLMLSIRAIQGWDLRDEIAARYLDLSISSTKSEAGFPVFLEYLARRLPHGRISARFGREMRAMATRADILRDNGLRRSALVIRAWSKLSRVAPRRAALPRPSRMRRCSGRGWSSCGGNFAYPRNWPDRREWSALWEASAIS